jgi:hypothetical protein
MSILKCTFIQIFIHFPDLYAQPNRELKEDCKGWEDRHNKTANREHVHFYEVLLENAKIAGRKPSTARC